MVIIKFFLLDVLVFVSIGCISCTNKKGAEMKIVHTTQEKDSISSSLCKKIGIPEDMILPINSQGMDSLMKVYQTSYLQSSSEDEEEDEVRIDERYINILIPYAFNDLAKRGFIPISSALYNKKLKELGLAPEQRQKQPYIYEYKHYFSSPTIMQGWTDDIAEDGIDKKEHEYIRYAPISNIFVKGYNFCLPKPMLDSFLRNNKGKIAFHLSDEIVHLNRFLFNDSKASFAWLLHNNPDALKDLLLSYGYDTNETINELVLKDISNEYTNVEDVSGLINTFIRKVYDKEPHIEIREGLMKTILRLPANDKNLKWQIILETYIDYLLKKDKAEGPYWLSHFTWEERYKAAAYLGYYLYKDRHRYQQIGSTGFANELYYNNEFRDNLEKHHYYKLPGFKETCGNIYKEYDFLVKSSHTGE